jgi:ureidoglycolate lyase
MRTVVARPLTPEAYEPFGDVVMAAARGAAARPANQGTARKYEHLAALENLRPGARANFSVFRCSPRLEFPLEVALLEKHPLSTQAFVPMTARRYLVVVAQGGDRPDLDTLAAFVARGDQAVTYRPGTWHHPMIALDAEIDFACVVWEDGGEDDCVELSYPPGERAVVVLPD